jgi:hypothetical protein
MINACTFNTILYGEFECTGDGTNMVGRGPYARKLNKLQAEPFLRTTYINGSEWLKTFNDTLIEWNLNNV